MHPNQKRKLHERDDVFAVLCEECQHFRIFELEALIDWFAMMDPAPLTAAIASELYGCIRAKAGVHFTERCTMRPYWTEHQKFERAKKEKPFQPTLRDVHSWEVITAVCTECRHASEVKNWIIEKQIGVNHPITTICKRLRCKGCGVRGRVQLSIVKLTKQPR